jgi:hypothetical protein
MENSWKRSTCSNRNDSSLPEKSTRCYDSGELSIRVSQAPWVWYEKLDGTLRKLGFHQSEHEHAIYCRRSMEGGRLIVGVYVDDLIITGTTPDEIVRFKEEMKLQFKMADLGLLTFYLGLELQ